MQWPSHLMNNFSIVVCPLCYASESPGRFDRMQTVEPHPQSVWFSRSGGEKESAILQSSYMMLTLCRGHTLKITVLGYTAKSPTGQQLIKLGWTSSTSWSWYFYWYWHWLSLDDCSLSSASFCYHRSICPHMHRYNYRCKYSEMWGWPPHSGKFS